MAEGGCVPLFGASATPAVGQLKSTIVPPTTTYRVRCPKKERSVSQRIGYLGHCCEAWGRGNSVGLGQAVLCDHETLALWAPGCKRRLVPHPVRL